jgi:hypothetical protein
LDRDIDSNLVTVLEAVGHGFCRAVDTHPDSLDFRFFDALDKGSTREPCHSKGGRRNRRLAGFEVDSNPHLVWILRGQAVKTEPGEQTNNAPPTYDDARSAAPTRGSWLLDLRDAADEDGPPFGQEALASLDRGLADLAAGRVKPLAEYERERGL